VQFALWRNPDCPFPAAPTAHSSRVDTRLVLACRTDDNTYLYVGDVAWLVSLRQEQPEVLRQLVAGEWIGLVLVARRLGLTIRGVYALVDNGELPVHHLGKHLAMRRSDVKRLLLLRT
jgi:excisionase family DNA binding protein